MREVQPQESSTTCREKARSLTSSSKKQQLDRDKFYKTFPTGRSGGNEDVSWYRGKYYSSWSARCKDGKDKKSSWQCDGGEDSSWHRGNDSSAWSARWKDGRSKNTLWQFNGGRSCSYRKGAANGRKLECQFLIDIKTENIEIEALRTAILGPHGQHMKLIAEKTGVKLRLRGRGSGFLEGIEQKEADEDLMLCLSAPSDAKYEDAKMRLAQHLMEVHARYEPNKKLSWHEGPRPQQESLLMGLSSLSIKWQPFVCY